MRQGSARVSARERKMKKADVISGIFLFVLGVSIAIESYRVSLGDFHSPGPGFFPFLTGTVIAGLSLVLVVIALRSNKHEKMAFFKDQGRLFKLIICIFTVFAYGFCLDHLGFVLCTVLYIGFIARAVGGMKWRKAVLFAILTSVGSYVIFVSFLKSDLPRGPWLF